MHEAHPQAFEASLIERGLRWRNIGSPGFTWSDCSAVVGFLPFDDPLVRDVRGENWWWYHPVVDHIVGIFDLLSLISFVTPRRDGLKRGDMPKPTVRPWQKVKDTKVLKVAAQPLDVLRKRLGWD